MKDFFKAHNIEFYSLIPLSKCKITKQYLLDQSSLDENSNVIVVLLPYRSEIKPKNLSVYASVPDYHEYVNILRKEAKEYVFKKYPDAKFEVFADHSPVNEVHAAIVSGLGFVGDNGLLINEKYSSFVFLCEFVTNLGEIELGIPFSTNDEIRTCIHCKACMRACPSHCMDESDPSPKTECLSAITQKKGNLSENEIEMMLKNHTIWGCDICQNVCPFTKNASYTPIPYFRDGVIETLTLEYLDNLSDDEFKKKPFSWRGKETIRRNLLIEKENGVTYD